MIGIYSIIPYNFMICFDEFLYLNFRNEISLHFYSFEKICQYKNQASIFDYGIALFFTCITLIVSIRVYTQIAVINQLHNRDNLDVYILRHSSWEYVSFNHCMNFFSQSHQWENTPREILKKERKLRKIWWLLPT